MTQAPPAGLDPPFGAPREGAGRHERETRQLVIAALAFFVFLAAVSIIVLRNVTSWAARSSLTSLAAHTRIAAGRLGPGRDPVALLGSDREFVSLLWEVPARWAGLYGPDGRLLARSGFLPRADETPAALPEGCRLAAGQEVRTVDLSVEDPPTVTVTVGLGEGRSLAVSYEAVTLRRVRRYVTVLSLFVVFSALALLALVFPFVRRLLQPIVALNRAARAASEVVPVPDDGPRDEAERALRTFARTVEELKLRSRELEELRRSEKERADALAVTSRTLVRSHPGGLLVFDARGVLTDANRHARELLELPREAVGRPAAEALDGLPALVLAAEKARGGVPTLNQDFLLGEPEPDEARQPGEARHLAVTAVPVEDPGRGHLGVLLFLEDRTVTTRLQRELSARRELAALGEMSAGIAHEFRNATATILGYARLAASAEDAEQRARYLTGVKSEAEHVARVTGDFLFFARPERLELTQLSLGDLAREVAGEESVSAGDVELTVEGEFGTAVVDAALFRRALVNLLRNAREAVSESPAPRRVMVRGEGALDGMIRVSVEDSGPGVPADVASKVFVPFFSTKEAGTGLGLALVARIAALHGGAVTVERSSRLGGARFVLSVRAHTTSTWPRIRPLPRSG